MSKRAVDGAEKKLSRTDSFASLSVFTLSTPLVTHYVPLAKTDEAMPALLSALFGSRQRSAAFSITTNACGSFLVLDEALHRELFGGAGSPPWSCLFLHEASERDGAEISGALSMLCGQLARARVPVLNVCTLARNVMLVRQAVADRAVATLRAAVEQAPVAAGGAAGGDAPTDGIGLELLQPEVAIGSLTLEQVKTCAHAILHLLFLRRGLQRVARTRFLHYFEMGGEVTLMVEEAALDALQKAEPASYDSLMAALEPSLTRGWRVLDITATSPGHDGVGILSSVCLPLASLPLMNVSTLDHSFVLLPGLHVDAALELLAAAQFSVQQE